MFYVKCGFLRGLKIVFPSGSYASLAEAHSNRCTGSAEVWMVEDKGLNFFLELSDRRRGGKFKKRGLLTLKRGSQVTRLGVSPRFKMCRSRKCLIS